MSNRKLPAFDLTELEKLCALHCTLDEIAGWFKVGDKTIDRRRADERTLYQHDGEKLTFKAIMDRGYARGRISLRRKQMQLAEAGNATMLVWLGKQILAQRDQIDQTLSAPGGGPVRVETYARDILARRLDSAAARLGTEPDVEQPKPRPN